MNFEFLHMPYILLYNLKLVRVVYMYNHANQWYVYKRLLE